MKRKIKKDDTVKVLSGNSRGETGKVLRCKGEKVWVQGLNKAKKHMKGQGDQPGQILEIERPFHISNLAVCVEGNEAVKLKRRISSDSSKELAYQKGGEWISYRTLRKQR
ncbi:MAG: 50S ribosomal protein L24 [Chlamydiia bacterium]|nr:50S ribosomal protein L24 [Chlamydiia bacterium]